MDVEKLIKTIRREHHLTQQQLADRLGVTNRAVSKWENGLSEPSAENLLQLITLFRESFLSFSDQTSTKRPFLKQQPNGMYSITDLYKIGRGPSSSHTIGPERICRQFRFENPSADAFCITLYGSLAMTGHGHATDAIIRETLSPIKTEIHFAPLDTAIEHQNTMDLSAYRNGNLLRKCRAYSIGGGDILFKGQKLPNKPIVYQDTTFAGVATTCKERNWRLWQYVEHHENQNFRQSMLHVWRQMKTSIIRGLEAGGTLPGGLNVVRKAGHLYHQNHMDESPETRETRTVCAYAFAVSEENASGGTVVTAPTCGSAGVLPAVLYHEQLSRHLSDDDIIHALETAGLIGNLIRRNASISGAECGCQAEIGSACAMASAALAELFHLRLDQIEYAAEIAIEHHLGLTCDPVCGLVQIPCIERNAVAAMRAINAVTLANFLSDTRKISLDHVILTMYETGLDLSKRYKETSEAGLAKLDLRSTGS